MENNDFGPMVSSEMAGSNEKETTDAQNEADMSKVEGSKDEANVELLRQRMESNEMEYSQKRAMFMKLYQQKEEELENMRRELSASHEENSQLKQQVETLRQEVDDIQTAMAISEGAKEDEIDAVTRKCQEEIASVQHIMEEESSGKLDQERYKWLKIQERLESELQELRNKLTQEREGFLASVAKTLQKKVTGPLAGNVSPSTEHENLEESMKKAQEDAEILKSVVMPLEEEIQLLKSRLRDACDKNDQYVKQIAELKGEEVPNDRMKELNQHLETEKASRTDLEMYVAVLNTQKTVLQEDTDRLRLQLQEVCRLLESEKREHDDLKRTWQMANDQFLESQRLMMMDMRRMESLLTAEQQRQISELKKKDAEREAQEQRVRDLEQQRKDEERRQQAAQKAALEAHDTTSISEVLMDKRGRAGSSSQASLTSVNSEDLLDSESSPGMRRSQSGSALSSGQDNHNTADTRSLQDVDALLRISPEKHINIPILSEAMQKAITDPTPENEISQSLIASAKAKMSDPVSMVGRRLVSEKEWHALQDELKAARQKLGQPCDMCNNYESQLQEVQEASKKMTGQLRTLERQLEAERQAMSNQQQYTSELETSLQSKAEDAQTQILTLVKKLEDSEKYVQGLQVQFTHIQAELQSQLKTLTEGREELQKQLDKLQAENDSLVDKHSKTSQQMQEESINLPNTVEELHLLLLKHREEIIAAKVAKEHMEDTKKSEILFLRDQMLSEQQERTRLEESLTNEISNLQEQLAMLQSAKSEMERQSSLRQEAENKVKETDTAMKNIQAKSKQLITALQGQLEEQTRAKEKLQEDVHQLRMKVQSLQVDLDNSEAVQRDFVKLSQSLQIQLEKIRASETEVRWQHEEDVEDCSNCKQPFSVTRRKHHCRHCGRIFCAECLNKSVNSGPNMRPSKVCDVCHTILVQDATPYFSSELPTTPP